MTTTPAEVEVPLVVPDGRTVLAKMLARFDEIYDETKRLEAEHLKAKATLDVLKDAIKEEVNRLGHNEVHLDHPQLQYILSCAHGTQTRMTAEDLLRFRVDFPDLWVLYSSVIPVTTIRRLTGARWRKRR